MPDMGNIVHLLKSNKPVRSSHCLPQMAACGEVATHSLCSEQDNAWIVRMPILSLKLSSLLAGSDACNCKYLLVVRSAS